MTDTFSHCRATLHDRLGIEENIRRRDPLKMSAEINGMVQSLDDIRDLCRPRLIMGGIRYGSEWKHKPLMDYMQKKFDLYRATGNFEMLVDLVNFCAIEGKLKTHPDHHFEAKDRT